MTPTSFNNFPSCADNGCCGAREAKKRREYGIFDGNLFFKYVSNYYSRFPSGRDNLVPIAFSQVRARWRREAWGKEACGKNVTVGGNFRQCLCWIVARSYDRSIRYAKRMGNCDMANEPSTSEPHEIIFSEEEIFDVSLATFYVFDRENAGAPPPTRPVKRGPCVGGCGSSVG
jgi:hypothetical protein